MLRDGAADIKSELLAETCCGVPYPYHSLKHTGPLNCLLIWLCVINGSVCVYVCGHSLNHVKAAGTLFTQIHCGFTLHSVLGNTCCKCFHNFHMASV